MEEKIELIKKHLTEINEELFKKYGTDSYSIRCAIADVKDSVSKLHQPTVSDAVCDCKIKLTVGEVFDNKCRICKKPIRQTDC